MEAATLKNKKSNRGKIKKNIKNVLCRPDPVHWPLLTKEERHQMELMLSRHKIEIPVFIKLHWRELKPIPKDQRPKPPKLKKVDGLFFGITEVTNAINTGQCSAVILEAAINPRMIVQHVIEACSKTNVPIVCLDDLRKTSQTCFGIPTSCLGVKSDTLSELTNVITELAKHHMKSQKSVDSIEKMDTEENIKENISERQTTKPLNVYLYRSSNKTRMFVPNSAKTDKFPNKFIGQDFIEFPTENAENKSMYMKMLVKRISNNADRVKKK